MKPILFTVSYGGYWGQTRLSLEDSIRKAKELGYSGVEVMGKRPHLSVVDCTLQDAKELRRLADDLGVEIATLAAYTNFTGGLESREVPFVEMQLAYLKRMAELGETLGAKIMRIFTGYFTDRLPYLAQWNLCVDAVREAAGIAAQHGITLGVQNHHDIGVSAESYEDFLDQVDHPNCKAMFDAWSIALHDSDLYYWARKLAPQASALASRPQRNQLPAPHAGRAPDGAHGRRLHRLQRFLPRPEGRRLRRLCLLRDVLADSRGRQPGELGYLRVQEPSRDSPAHRRLATPTKRALGHS